MDIDAFLRALEAGIGGLPSVIIVVALLGGPTVIWLLYRYFVQPRSSRYRASPMGLIWICRGCQSANELGSSRCYRCHGELAEADLFLNLPGLDASIPMRPPAATPRPATGVSGRAPVAVGPGKTRTAPRRRAVVVVERSEPGATDVEGPLAASASPRRIRKR
jgi:hypothetical protein